MNLEQFKCFVENLIPLPFDKNYIEALKTIYVDRLLSESLSEEDLALIKLAFLNREKDVAHDAYAYTSIIKEVLEYNEPWLDLAQALCAEDGVFDFHFFELLFSQASNLAGIDVSTLAPIIGENLSDLFLSESNKLLNLKTAYTCAQGNCGEKGFYLYVSDESNEKLSWYKLSDSDEVLLQATNPDYFLKFKKLAELKENNDDGMRLNYVTVEALILLVECSDFESGRHQYYNETETKAAKTAYESFIDFLALLSETENDNLMGQIIRYDGNGFPFKHLWNSVTSSQWCVSWANKEIIRLILDYKPKHVFRNSSLKDCVPSTIRSNKPKKNYSIECPFENLSQLLSMAFVVVTELLNNGFESDIQNRFLLNELFPLAGRINAGERSNATKESCIVLVTKSMAMYDDFLLNTTLKKGFSDLAANNYILSAKSKLLTYFSMLSLNKSKRMMNRLIRETLSFEVFKILLARNGNFFQLFKGMQTQKDKIFFAEMSKQIAMGFVIVEQLKEIDGNSSRLDDLSDTLFLYVSQEVTPNDTQAIVNELIKLFMIKMTSLNGGDSHSSPLQEPALKQIRRLSRQISSLFSDVVQNRIKKTCIDHFLKVLCEPTDGVSLFPQALTDSAGKVVDIRQLTLKCMKHFEYFEVEQKTLYNELYQFICSLPGYSFSKASKDRAYALVINYSKPIRVINDTFDL